MKTTTPFAARSPFHLTEAQIDFFDENGYLVLKNWIQGDMLARAQEAGTRWIEQGLSLTQAAAQNAEGDSAALDTDDYAFADRPQGRVLFRVDYLHRKNTGRDGENASLALLGSPQVLAVAESLCGRNFVPTYESMVFKMPGDGEAIPWHQDAVFPRRFRVFNFDLYLDASVAGGGALHVVPASHREIHDVCRVRDQFGWDHPDMITVEMEPGDVLLHDDMVLHGSPRVEGKALRRTIYFEFRGVEQILTEGPWDADWIDRRLRLIPLALRQYQAQYPGAPRFDWQIDPQYVPDVIEDEADALRVIHKIHTHGSYCSAGSSL